jgi:5-methylthioribose kinase
LAEFKNTYFRKLYIQQIESIFSKDCRIEWKKQNSYKFLFEKTLSITLKQIFSEDIFGLFENYRKKLLNFGQNVCQWLLSSFLSN